MSARLFLSLLFVSFTGSGFAVAAPHDHAHESAAAVYQCPMHPWIRSDHPGKCTICGMDLVAASATAPSAEGLVSLSAASVSVIGVQTATVTRQPLTRTLRVTGRIDDDDTRHRILSARVPGRVEKLFVNFVGAPVEAGAPLATLWSAELLTAERVYVERLKAGPLVYPAAELAAAREQLQQLGLAEPDLAELEKSRTPSAYVTVRAPSAGTVVAKSVYEGQYVQASDRLFEIADFSTMWFVFDAYAPDLPWLRTGLPVEVTTDAVPGEVITAPIEFIDPNFDEMTQTARVRAVLPNPHYSVAGVAHRLPHRVYAEGRVLVETPAVLALPRSAVLNPGTGPVAYVAVDDHTFAPRAVQLGRTGDALVEILSGLSEGDRVVTQGNLLIDAQAQLSHAPAPAAAPPSPSATLSDAALLDLANRAIDAADALASDDYARYQKLFPTLATPDATLPSLELGTSLTEARRSFEPWSTAVATLLQPQHTRLGVKIFQCPMSPVSQKGRWVQRSLPLKNPFFGAAMPDCGNEVP
ncbi:MAG: efflux RND transporter periplasmic adaptor subunit [Verrucomicrobia bacterium]|nr:efflux RND transporter periplasmic adaptor subunit [Verrucomicrobiota bacterium]